MTTAPTEKAAWRSKMLKRWKAAYYAGNPLISDAEYDYHEKKQKEEWPEDPELQVVGGIEQSPFEQVTDGEPMLSLKKTYSPDELKSFIKNRPIIVELKLDGGSLELRYKEGFLAQAVTRGRGGELGSDVTQNAMFLKDVPHFIEGFTGEIRGEVIQTFEDFEKCNKKYAEEGKKSLKHPRNTANGTLQAHDPQLVAERNLRFAACLIVGQEETFPNEVDVLHWLKEKGFKLPRTTSYRKAEAFTRAVEAQLLTWQQRMKEAPYPCDGIVVQLADRVLRKNLGTATTHPHGAIAFKWEDETAESKVVNIEWSTGRFGDVDPVAIIEPVQLSGAEIERATLHHVGYVRKHNIKIGSVIKIIRSGEIIPKHIDTISTPDGVEFNIPTECPTCSHKLIEEEGVTEGAFTLLCTNPNCPAQKFEKIVNYVKKAKIDHLGTGILEALFKQGYLESIPHLYLLPAKGIESLHLNGKSLGVRRTKKINISIEKASTLTLPQFIAALGMRGIGEGNAEKLCRVFDTLEKVKGATVQDLLKVEGFALTRAQVTYEGIQSHLELIKQLEAFVKIKSDDVLTLPRVLSGLRLVVTGSFSDENPRKEIEKMIKEAGGQIQSKPNKFTSYLIKGQGGGQKASIAAKFNTPVLDEEGFFDLITARSEKFEKEDVDEDDE